MGVGAGAGVGVGAGMGVGAGSSAHVGAAINEANKTIEEAARRWPRGT